MTTNLIGITDLELHIPTKQDLLLFDEIGIAGLDHALAKIKNKKILSDIEYLADQGIIFNAQYTATPETKNSPLENGLTEIATTSLLLGFVVKSNEETEWKFFADSEIVQKVAEKLITAPGINIERVSNLVSSKVRELQALKNSSPTANFSEMANMLEESSIISTVRLLSIHYSNHLRANAVPLIKVPSFGIFGKTDDQDVAKLVIRKLPMPNEDTPLEAILDFRKDPESRRRLVDLRYWMNNVRNDVNKGKVSYDELEEQLEYLLHEYAEYMKLQKMKINTTFLETTFTMAAGLVENLIKIKFEAAVKSLFLVRHRKIALLEAELAAPGRQVAFVVSATETFGDK